MSDSLSQQFISALEAQRDRLYAQALGLTKTPGAAESLLQKTLRQSFHVYAAGAAPADFVPWIQRQIAGAADSAAGAPAAAPMPAATWARLAAGVQLEAAQSGAAKALNPESVLLAPDPLLAPRKRALTEEPATGLNLSPTARFILAVTLALLVGITFSLFYCTRTVPPATRPAPPPATQPNMGH